ncbi:MAG TPA: hypothetical protein EYH09_00275 [Candidatus Nanopusillus sp.]|nr:hypothetical protein [Candidatus Nanopusillus sp.]
MDPSIITNITNNIIITHVTNNTIIATTLLAITDSINPCTLAVQLALLASLLTAKGRRSVLLGGILFSITIYIMYTLYGLGILKVIYTLGIDHLLRYILKGLLIVLASLEILAYFHYRPGMVSLEMPLRLRPIARKILSSVNNPLTALPAAVLCSVLLLPCSSGPYLAMLMMIGTMEQYKQLLWILYYNIWFILPMILITLLVYFGLKPQKVTEWRKKHIKELHLIAGLLLLLVFFMV